MAGRPSKLTPEVAEKILQALRAANFRKVAAEYAGVTPRVLRMWLQRGKRSPKSRYGHFFRQVLEAEKAAEMRAVALIMKAAQEDARHAEWWLERKFPNRWGRKERHELTGAKGGPIRHQESELPVELLSNPQLRELLDSAAALASQLSAPAQIDERVAVPERAKAKS